MPKGTSIFKSVAKIPDYVKLLEASGFYPSGYGGTGKYFEFKGWDECAQLENELAAEIEEDKRWGAEMESRFVSDERKKIWKEAQVRASGSVGANGESSEKEGRHDGQSTDGAAQKKEQRESGAEPSLPSDDGTDAGNQLSAPLRTLSALVGRLANGDLSEEDIRAVTSASRTSTAATADEAATAGRVDGESLGTKQASEHNCTGGASSTGASSESDSHSVSFTGPSSGAGPLNGPLPESVRAVLEKVRDALEMLKESEASLAKWDDEEKIRRQRNSGPTQAALDSFCGTQINSDDTIFSKMGAEGTTATGTLHSNTADIDASAAHAASGWVEAKQNKDQLHVTHEGGLRSSPAVGTAEDVGEEEDGKDMEEVGITGRETSQVVAVSTDLASISSSSALATPIIMESPGVEDGERGGSPLTSGVANEEVESFAVEASSLPSFNFASLDSSDVRVTDVGRGGDASEGIGNGEEGDYDTSLPFAEVMRRVQDNQPIPGIKTIPDK